MICINFVCYFFTIKFSIRLYFNKAVFYFDLVSSVTQYHCFEYWQRAAMARERGHLSVYRRIAEPWSWRDGWGVLGDRQPHNPHPHPLPPFSCLLQLNFRGNSNNTHMGWGG